MFEAFRRDPETKQTKGDKTKKAHETKQTDLYVLFPFPCLFCLLLFVLFPFPCLFCLLLLVCFVSFSLFALSRVPCGNLCILFEDVSYVMIANVKCLHDHHDNGGDNDDDADDAAAYDDA